ncbi:MAG: 3'-5' exonuclease [Paramuribaculum sp.]|nr:3'-5' exonuclease [Paramuribaculum sp.]
MDNFVAIDVETANNEPTSVCAIGAVKVIDGTIVGSLYELVKPEPEFYFRYFTEKIHGIGQADTADKPTFDRVWPAFKDFIGDLPLVAHNKAFDEKCIRACFKTYRMDYPDYDFYCTYQSARRHIPKQLCGRYSLPYVCQFLGIPFFNHHNALADAEACAKIAMALL